MRPVLTEKDGSSLQPALFLLLAAALGGLRAWEALTAFSALFFIRIAFFDEDFSASGLGVWGLLALWLAAGLAFSPEPRNSFCQFSRYSMLFAFFIFSSRRGPAARRAWTGAVFFLGALAAVISLAEAALGLGPGGILGVNPNYAAAFMAAALAGSAALSAGAEGTRGKLRAAAGMALFSAGLLAVNSRGGILGALAGVFYVLWRRKALRPALYLAAGLLLVPALLPKGQLAWLLKLGDPYSLERLKIWRTALDAIAAAPVFGAGPGLFERAFETFKFPFYNGISFYGHSTPHAHSELLNLAAEAGIPAACLLVWGWGRAVFAADGGDRWEPVLKAFAVALFAQAAVDIIFYSGAVQLFFFGTLGLLAAGSTRLADAPGARVRALSLLLACWCAAFILRSGFERDKGCALDEAGAPAAREACLKKASVFAPGDAALLEAAIPLSLAVRGNYAYTAALAGEAALKRPRDPFPLFARAETFYLSGAIVPAKKELYGALALEPAFLRARLRLAWILAAEKNYRAAAVELSRIEGEWGKNRAAPRTSYDSGLLALPEAPYAELRKEIWKKLPGGRTTALNRKTR
ncbi:MAG: O-antigen ligase family protein [Elusimicrobiota bacterium]